MLVSRRIVGPAINSGCPLTGILRAGLRTPPARELYQVPSRLPPSLPPNVTGDVFVGRALSHPPKLDPHCACGRRGRHGARDAFQPHGASKFAAGLAAVPGDPGPAAVTPAWRAHGQLLCGPAGTRRRRARSQAGRNGGHGSARRQMPHSGIGEIGG